jgi:hypothetical protein
MRKITVIHVPSEYPLGTTDGTDYTITPIR